MRSRSRLFQAAIHSAAKSRASISVMTHAPAEIQDRSSNLYDVRNKSLDSFFVVRVCVAELGGHKGLFHAQLHPPSPHDQRKAQKGVYVAVDRRCTQKGEQKAG